jgi:hypothetical protein
VNVLYANVLECGVAVMDRLMNGRKEEKRS